MLLTFVPNNRISEKVLCVFNVSNQDRVRVGMFGAGMNRVIVLIVLVIVLVVLIRVGIPAYECLNFVISLQVRFENPCSEEVVLSDPTYPVGDVDSLIKLGIRTG
jgi:hypothetical protein